MGPALRQAIQRTPASLAVLAVVGIVAALGTAGAEIGPLTIVGIVAQFAFNAMLAVLLVRAARRANGRTRLGLAAFAATPVLAALAIPILAAEALRTGDATVAPTVLAPVLAIATAASLTGYILLAPPQVRGGTAARFALDATIASVSTFSILWAFLDQPLEGTPFDVVLLALYPATSAACAMVALLVVGSLGGRVPPWYGALAASAILVLATDVGATAADLVQQPLLASVVGNLGYTASQVLLAVAALRLAPWPAGHRHEAFRAQWIPYVPFGLAMLVAVADYLENTGIALDRFLLVMAMVGLVVARTIVLLVENRRLARDLRHTDAFKTQLLRFISHEIANPLSPLKLQARLLREGRTDPAKGWDVLGRSITRLETLSNDVRAMALADTQRLVGPLSAQPLAPRVQASVEAYKAIAAQKGVRLDARMDGDPVVPCDGARIDQVLDNLLSNAVKFTPPGGAVQVVAGPRPRGGAQIEVSDTGAGMAAPQLASLFTPFGRVHATGEPGLGLGLYLCKAIVEAHGGSIRATSPGPGRGSAFIVELPPEQARRAAAPAIPAGAPAE